MFTGLIEDIAEIKSLRRALNAAEIALSLNIPLSEIKIGDSIAINGVCLTVTKIENRILFFDVSPETLSRTTLGELKPAAKVNIERALQFGSRLDGHIVSGHIDSVATVASITGNSGNIEITFKMDKQMMRYIIEKGSVAVNGISLTVNRVYEDSFSLNIIPHTASKTTLSLLKIGDRVNIETDIIGKYVEKLSNSWLKKGELTMEKLIENGFA